MESSSKRSKLRKGVKSLIDKLAISRSGSRSRSRSPSRSFHQPDSQTPIPPADPRGDSTSPSGVSPVTQVQDCLGESAATSPAGSRPEPGLGVPTVIEPSGEGRLQAHPEAESENSSSSTGISGPATSTPRHSKADRQTKGPARTALRTSLGLLQDASNVFPPLSSAVGILISCLDGLETTMKSKHREEYEELASTVSVLVESLKQHSSTISQSVPMTKLTLSLEQEAKELQETQDKLKAGGLRETDGSEEVLLRKYRRVQWLFQQLQTNANLSAWSILNEQSTDSRLKDLNPVMQATYDSNLSMDVSRRGCTDGTRTAVLAGLHDWLLDSSSPSVYWMNGMAGTGKTTIAYTFCEQAEQRKQLAASFFCTRSSVDCKKTTRIIPTIAYQLARYSIPYRSVLCQLLEQNPDIGSKHMAKQFEQLLRDPLEKARNAIPGDSVVVVDALDECEDRNGVELILDILFRWAGHAPLKFLITGRPEPEIFNKMRLHEQSRAVIHLHDIETSLVRADIELYLNEELAFMSPNQAEIKQLSHRAGNLFIYAATLVRYIVYGKRVANPRQRLQSVLTLAESTKKHTEIDALYTAILESALREVEMEDEEAEDVRAVLRVVLFAQEPIDLKTIAELSGLDGAERVSYALQPLRSVIHQSEENGLVSTLHASFPDFLLSSKRSGVFFCDVVEYSHFLAERCFAIMRKVLRFNICTLESSFVPDENVENLQARVTANITPPLAYVCQYWANHLGMAKKTGVLMRLLNEFLSNQLLFWMEVLNLKHITHSGRDILQKANSWINQIGSPVPEELLRRLAEDSYAFVTNFAGSAASQSTPHIYISCLPFCPRSSQVYKHYWNRMQGLLLLEGSLIERRESAALASWKRKGFTGGAFSSDGTRFIAGLDDAVVILNAYNGIPFVEPLLGHAKKVSASGISPDGSRVASGSKDGTVRIWDAYNGVLIAGPYEFESSHIRPIAFSTGGTMIPTQFQHDKHYINHLALSPDGVLLAACFRMASTIYLWEAISGRLLAVLESHTDVINMVQVSPDSKMIASASDNAIFRLWNVQDGTLVTPPYEGRTPCSAVLVAFTPDGSRLVCSSLDIQVWNFSDGSLVAQFAFDLKVRSLAVSPDGMQVASGSEDCTIRVWQTDNGTLLAGPFHASLDTTVLALTPVTMLSYAQDHPHLISHAADGTFAVWPAHKDVLSKVPPSTRLPTNGIDSMTFSADGTHILTLDTSGEVIRKWDVSDGSFAEVLDKNYPFYGRNSNPLYSPNGLYAVTLVQKNRQVVNTNDKSIVLGPWPLGGLGYRVAAQFSQDSTKVAVGFQDGTIKVWDIQSREVIAGPFSGHIRAVNLVALSPDSSLIASAADNTLRIFNIYAPVLDIAATASAELDSVSHPTRSRVYDGWNIRKDGWVTNSNSDLLYWAPLELRLAWPSPYTSLLVGWAGTVQVPKQTLFFGEAWFRCYLPENR